LASNEKFEEIKELTRKPEYICFIRRKHREAMRLAARERKR
jgi:hypothetical protein